MLADRFQHDTEDIGEARAEVNAALAGLALAQAELAKVELKDAARRGGQLGATGVGAALAGGVSLLFAALGAAFALALVIPMWAAFLVVAALFGAPATLLAGAAVHAARRFRPIPPETLASLQEHVQWIRTRVHGS